MKKKVSFGRLFCDFTEPFGAKFRLYKQRSILKNTETERIMERFEALLEKHRAVIERFVKFRMPGADADDILQEVYLTAYQKFDTLKNEESFKAWLISIARNACYDYFRKQAKIDEIPLDTLSEAEISYGRSGRTEFYLVYDALSRLDDKDRQILYFYFWRELSQAEIAKRLQIPLGTVKSRLHTAKKHFKAAYPYTFPTAKGNHIMKTLPKTLPAYTITPSEKAPFPVVWEEMMGWFIIPRVGEHNTWGQYDMPTRTLTGEYHSVVTSKVMLHGMEGVEIKSTSNKESHEHFYIAQLTDTHCRMLGERYTKNDMLHYLTFLDGESFLEDWGFGEDNCGNETHLSPKGEITRKGNIITAKESRYLLDIVGRYTVTINGKSYDTVCLMIVDSGNDAAMTEQFLDQNGRTILWRRFNPDDWAIEHYQKKWSEMFPENEQLTVNGKAYVHWYDCITDYIL